MAAWRPLRARGPGAPRHPRRQAPGKPVRRHVPRHADPRLPPRQALRGRAGRLHLLLQHDTVQKQEHGGARGGGRPVEGEQLQDGGVAVGRKITMNFYEHSGDNDPVRKRGEEQPESDDDPRAA